MPPLMGVQPPGSGQLSFVHGGVRAEGGGQVGAHGGAVHVDCFGQTLVRQAEQKVLAVAEARHFYVDAAVGDDSSCDVNRPTALDVTGQQFAAHAVTHVVCDKG